eukprot:CAMPEP_0170166738 /NCGR_PEP_ID=MMETSP0040_2-20121228/340_1 /TAXON_ID=641309 /ORGANISM="Lotharella oceanica, Strain CCMP622" /LENGTH=95 /DNA_ID=CAMNT_0010404543 /DNA_START=363 /DNA_END=650 /DNA_ORIENTATION=-
MAYQKSCTSFEDLLKLCVAVDEELIFSGTKSKMEYFKNAYRWNDRLQIKTKQLNGKLSLGNNGYPVKRPVTGQVAPPPPLKRSREEPKDGSAKTS